MLKYSFLIEGNGKQRECFMLGENPKDAEVKLKSAIDENNRDFDRRTRIVKFIGLDLTPIR